MRRAFSLYSEPIRSMVASAAGYADGIAAECGAVRAGLPGVHDAGTSHECAEGHAAGDAFGAAQNVWLDAGVFGGPPLTGAAHAGLHFVQNERMPCWRQDALQFLQEEFRRGYVAAFALYGLDYDGGDFLGIEEALEDLALERFQDFRATGFGGVVVRAAVRVGIGNVLDAGEKRAEALALRGLGCGERECAHGTSVEAAVESDELVPLGWRNSASFMAPSMAQCPSS